MKWNEQCAAFRRDGEPCQAPAITGGFVCRRHGGSAQQVQFAAERRRRQEVLLAAIRAWQDADEQADPRAPELFGMVSSARRDLTGYEEKLAELARLRAAVRRQSAARDRSGRAAHDVSP